MATKLAGTKGKDWRRGDMYSVDPHKIVVRNDLRGRHFPPTDHDIIRRAVSLYRYGQIQPCEVRLVTQGGVSNVPILNSGFTRTAAARLLRDGFNIPEGFEEEVIAEDAKAKVAPVKPGDFIQESSFMLQIRHVKCNDEQALIRNIVENNERNDTSDVDDAYNYERLRNNCGMSNADIARLYGYGAGGQTKVSRLSRLLELPEWMQERVHYGEVPTQAALDLLDSGKPPAEWPKLLEASTNDKGKVVATRLRDTVREEQLADFDDADEADAAIESGDHPVASNNDGSPQKPKVKPRSMTNLKKLIDSACSGEWDGVDESTVVLLRKIKMWIGGRIKDETLLNAFVEHLYSEPSESSEMDEQEEQKEKQEAA